MAGGKGAKYALRRTLPSWCFDECLEELLEFCKDAVIDEVIVKVDVEEFSHGIPTVEWLKGYMPFLERARDALAGAGVVFSINPWLTVGHLDRGRDLRSVFPDFVWMVGHKGKECHACACPLSEAWRNHTRTLWQMYASLKPNVIWVEDDIRTFNHTPIDYGCFCRLHLERFSRLVGEEVDRQKLVSAITQPGQPQPWREKWFNLLRDVIEETCAYLAKSVHEISPETCLGLMSSGPAMHCVEGRDWERLGMILTDGKDLYSRPTLGNYNETSLRGLYYSSAQIKRTRYVLPPGTIEQTEIENVPFTGYSKSVTFTFLQLALSLSHGCDGATMNLFDHMGSSIAVDPYVADMLGGNRRFIDSISESHVPAGEFAGVRILHHERASIVRKLQPGNDYDAFVPPDYVWEEALNSLGITTTYTDSPVIAADGQMIGAFSDDDIKEMLSKGILLDLSAAETLIERGFGNLIGITVKESRGIHDNIPVGAEELIDPEFGGEPGRYLTMTIPDLIHDGKLGFLERAEGTRTISRLVNPDRETICEFITLYENTNGGRVAVVPLEMRTAFGTGFLHPFRKKQMTALLCWLSRDRLPAVVSGGVYPLAYRMDFPDRIMFGVFNLSQDEWRDVTWEMCLDFVPEKIDVLKRNGIWMLTRSRIEEISSRNYRITVPRSLLCTIPLICRIRH